MSRKQFFLLADDDKDDIEILEKSLKSINPDILFLTVGDGKKAIEFLENCPSESLPTAIILDYNMPNVNGPGVLDWLFANPRYNGINKFIWSTAFQQEYIDDCLHKGAIEYFIKPITIEGIDEIVKKIIVCSEK